MLSEFPFIFHSSFWSLCVCKSNFWMASTGNSVSIMICPLLFGYQCEMTHDITHSVVPCPVDIRKCLTKGSYFTYIEAVDSILTSCCIAFVYGCY